MKTYLFLFTLGPVQSFIAQARKVHDLHSGSRILSDLCRVAAEKFKELSGNIIFPDIESTSIPNRFLGKITCTPEKLDDIGKSVADAVQDYWRKQFDEPQKGVSISLAELLAPTTYHEAKRQIEQHLDIQWLFQPLADENNETYRSAYDELNKNLNAIKNTRPFHTPEETGRKCSLDGERNVIFYRKSEGQREKSVDDLQQGNPLFSVMNCVFEYDDVSKLQLRHLQPGEGLSAVSMLKRFQDFGPDDFPDTAEFALADTMQAIGKECLDKMTELFRHNHSKHLNWQLFFEENLNETYFKKQGLLLGRLPEAIKIQEKLADAAHDKGRKLEKYYALVVFDGDHMGKWWGGDKNFLNPDMQLKDFQEKLTQQLAVFAAAVREEYPIEPQHRGWVIYAGGDDFLGFFNLHHLSDGLNFLKVKYREIVHEPLSDYLQEGRMLTFSAGVSIAHYKEPLSLVLAQARDMEHQAKDLDKENKNAIGIAVIPGSGQIAKVVLPFGEFPHLQTVISNLQAFDFDLQKHLFSNAFVSKARAELAAFVEKDGKLIDALAPTAKALLDRAVNRACNLIQEEGESKEAFEKRKKEKVEPLQDAVKALLNFDSQNLGAFFDALDIADFIERQTHISPLKNEPVKA